jgi:tripartite-type tricarboxylate transporter receptor subunit TctC
MLRKKQKKPLPSGPAWGTSAIVRALFAASLCAGWTPYLIAPAYAQSQSQTYPNRPIKVIVPFPAGGPTDGMARIISDRLGTVLGQSIVIENRGGGAGGSVGAKVVASAEPDGYTILMTPGGSLVTGPAVHKNIGYDPFKVFTPVGKLIETPQYICVHPDLPVKSLAEVAAYAKANPGKLSWGTQGFGTGTHLLSELFKSRPAPTSCTCLTAAPHRCSPPFWPAKSKSRSTRARPCCRRSRPAGCGRSPSP